MPASADGDGGLPLSDITDPGLAEAGRARIEWAQRGMPVLRLLAERFSAQRPFAGLTIAACLHVTAETAGLVNALRAGGARVLLAASNPLSTQDDVAAALAAGGAAAVFARAGVDRLGYDEHIHRALDAGPGRPRPGDRRRRRPGEHAPRGAPGPARRGARRLRVHRHRGDQAAPDGR